MLGLSKYALIRLILSVAAVSAIALLIPNSGTAQIREVSLSELTQASTSVILGTTTAKESYWDDGRTKILTRVTIQVDESVKGVGDGETIVTVPGGQVGNTLYEVSDMPAFIEGQEVLVFLWRHPTGANLVTGGMQGKLEVVEDASSGRKLVPGARTLMGREAVTAGKTSAAGVSAGIELENVLTSIRSISQ